MLSQLEHEPHLAALDVVHRTQQLHDVGVAQPVQGGKLAPRGTLRCVVPGIGLLHGDREPVQRPRGLAHTGVRTAAKLAGREYKVRPEVRRQRAQPPAVAHSRRCRRRRFHMQAHLLPAPEHVAHRGVDAEAKALDILVPQRLLAERTQRPASVGNRAVHIQGRALERVAARGGHRLLRWLERERADARRLCAHDGQRALERLQRERHRSWRARGSPA
ncbi:hypothetical protein T492DRAFT_1002676, partial [Pavlovales sp. CCMP2436]